MCYQIYLVKKGVKINEKVMLCWTTVSCNFQYKLLGLSKCHVAVSRAEFKQVLWLKNNEKKKNYMMVYMLPPHGEFASEAFCLTPTRWGHSLFPRSEIRIGSIAILTPTRRGFSHRPQRVGVTQNDPDPKHIVRPA